MTKEPFLLKVKNGRILIEFFNPDRPIPYLSVKGRLNNKQIQDQLIMLGRKLGIDDLCKSLILLNQCRGYSHEGANPTTRKL